MKKVVLLISFMVLSVSIVQGQDNKLRLDSIVSYTIFLPDSSYYWKKCFEYDNLGQPLLEGEYRTYNNGRTWQAERLIQKVFDHDGNAVKVDTYRRAVPWTYIDEYFHYEKTYDREGNVRIDSISIKNIETDEWFPMVRYEYTYNDKDQLITMYSWNWSYRDQIWDHPRKTEYIYNSNNDILLIQPSSKNNSNDWVLSTHSTRTYEYDEIGRLSKYYYRTIDYDIPVNMLLEYTYPTDTSRNVTTFKQYISDTVYRAFSVSKEMYSGAGLLTSRVLETFSWDNGMIPNEKTTWQYDDDGNTLISTLYDRFGNDWRIRRRSTYYYNHLSYSPLKHRSSDISIFPNPTSGLINITGLKQPAEVKIYSIHGQLLKSESQVEGSIDISELEAGVYILNLSSDGTLVREVVVKN